MNGLTDDVRADLERLRRALAGGDGAELTAAMAALDARVRRGGEGMDPQLRHFLAQRSYVKAFRHAGLEGAAA